MRSEDISITSWQSGSESAVLTGHLLCYIDKVQKMRTKILRHLSLTKAPENPELFSLEET